MMENAIVMTAFFMILFGIIDMSRAVFAYNSAQFAAREGARYASVRGSESGAEATTDMIRNYAAGLLPGIKASDVTVSTVWAPDKKRGSMVTVTVVTKFDPVTPFIPQGSWNLQGLARMMISQ